MINKLTIDGVHKIIKGSIMITYISNMILGWSLDDRNIVDTIITWSGWTIVGLFEYFCNIFKSNKMLALLIDILSIKCVHEFLKILVLIIYILNMILTCSSPRRPLFLHALSFECTSKLCIHFLNQFLVYFHIYKMHYTI